MNPEQSLIQAIDFGKLLGRLPREELIMLVLKNSFGCSWREIGKIGWLGKIRTAQRTYQRASWRLVELLSVYWGVPVGEIIPTIHAVADEKGRVKFD